MSLDRTLNLSIFTEAKSPIRRQNDFQKDNKKHHCMYKNEKLFSRDSKGPMYGGSLGSQGPFLKQSKQAESKHKRYYIAERSSFYEYFCFEILNAIGFISPKLRFIQPFSKDDYSRLLVASKDLQGYTPISTYLGEGLHPKSLDKIAKEFYLDEKNQMIIHKHQKKSYRISGNIYGCYLGALLLQDADFQPREGNCGFITDGHRYYFAVIDKGRASFAKNENFSQLEEFFSNKHFPQGNREQLLAVAYQIYKLVKNKNPSNLNNIFFNQRTSEIIKFSCPVVLVNCANVILEQLLPEANGGKFQHEFIRNLQLRLLTLSYKAEKILSLEETDKWMAEMNSICVDTYNIIADNKEYQHLDHSSIKSKFLTLLDKQKYRFDPRIQYERFTNNAELIINHYFESIENILAFEKRETVRCKIAYDILSDLKEKTKTDITLDMFENLIEDLRAPYYSNYFHNKKDQLISSHDLLNQSLFKKIEEDIMIEHQLTLISEKNFFL